MDPSYFNLQISSKDEMLSWMQNKVNKSTTIEDIVPMMNKLFSVNELQEIMTSNIENTFIQPNTEDPILRSSKLRSMYLNSCAINEIFSTDIMVKIIKYLGCWDEYRKLAKLSTSFSKMLFHNPSIFGDYSVKICHEIQEKSEEKEEEHTGEKDRKQNTKIKKFYKVNIKHETKYCNLTICEKMNVSKQLIDLQFKSLLNNIYNNSIFPLFFIKKWHFTNDTRSRGRWYWYSGRRKKSNSESSLEFDLNNDSKNNNNNDDTKCNNNDYNCKNSDSSTFDLIRYILNKAKDNVESLKFEKKAIALNNSDTDNTDNNIDMDMDMNVYPKFGDKLFHLLFKHMEYGSLVLNFLENKINIDKLEILELNNIYDSPRLSKKSLINPKMTLSAIKNELKQLLLENKLVTTDDEIDKDNDKATMFKDAASLDDLLFETEKYYLIEQILTVLKNNSKDNSLNLKVLSLNIDIKQNEILECDFVSKNGDPSWSKQPVWFKKCQNEANYQNIKEKYFKYVDYANFIINIPQCNDLQFLYISNFMCKINISSLKKNNYNLICLNVLNMVPYQFINCNQCKSRIQIDCVMFNNEYHYAYCRSFEEIWYDFIDKLNKPHKINNNNNNNNNNVINSSSDNNSNNNCDIGSCALEMIFFECQNDSDGYYFRKYETNFSQSMLKTCASDIKTIEDYEIPKNGDIWHDINIIQHYWKWRKNKKECIQIYQKNKFAKDTFNLLLKYHFNGFKNSVLNDEMSLYKQTVKKYQKWFDMGILKWLQKINDMRFRHHLTGSEYDSDDQWD